MVHAELPLLVELLLLLVEVLLVELELVEVLLVEVLLLELLVPAPPVPAPPDPPVFPVSVPPPQAASETARGIAQHTTYRTFICNALFESGALGARGGDGEGAVFHITSPS